MKFFKYKEFLFLIIFSAFFLYTSSLKLQNQSQSLATSNDIDDDDDLVSSENKPIQNQKINKEEKKDNENKNEINLLEKKNLRKEMNENKPGFSFKSKEMQEDDDDDFNMNTKKPKYTPYNKVSNKDYSSSGFRDKMNSFKENMAMNLQSQKTYKSSPIEGYLEKFKKRRYVKPGQDLFLGFLKYMSSTAENIMQKKVNDKRRQLY